MPSSMLEQPTLPKTFFSALFLLLLVAAAPAAWAAERGDRAGQRVLFRTLEAAARNGALAPDDARLAALRDYPLHDYVIAADLRYRLKHHANAALDREMAEFIDQHPDLPPAQRLRSPWLKSLAKRERWQQLLAHSRDDDSGADLCSAVHARIALGQAPQSAALALWRVGKSQPDACDPVFDWLDDQGLLTGAEIQRRARLAYLAGQYGLVRYLARKLPAARRDTVEQWLAVIDQPGRLRSAVELPDDILAKAFKSYALRHWSAAARLYPQLVEQLQPGPQARYEMQHYIALLFAQDHRPEALLWFARLDPARMDDHTRGWQARAAIQQQRWPLVIDAIRAMPAEQANEEEWQYWRGRALLAIGDDDQARQILEPLARERSYHGYLAADLLDMGYSFNERPLPANNAARNRILAKPALARAAELHALDRGWQFRLEWNALIRHLEADELREAARLAAQRGWYSRAIITLARSNYWDDLDIRYPTPFLEQIEDAAALGNLSAAYILAIMRTESLFVPTAVSPAGAVGLMQLMPGTAALMAGKLGMAKPSRLALYQPTTNIRLGTGYLQRMLARFGGNPALAAAAYNAGPGKVQHWLPQTDDLAPAIWIANIPYTETRKYVQNVLAHMMVFRYRLGAGPLSLSRQLPAVQSHYPRES